MPRLSARQRSRIYSNLEKYAHSGMGMEKACESLLRQPRLLRSEAQLYRGLREGIKGGHRISEALAGAGSFVSPLEREVIAAAESGGQLEKGFAHLAEYFRRLDQTRKKVLKGLTYPLLLIHLAIPVSVLSVSAFANLRLDGSGDSSFDISGTLARSGALMLLLWLVILFTLATVWWLFRLGRTSPSIDSLFMKLPLVGSARRAIAMERFSQVFEIFLLAGRKMSDSLDGAARASGSGLLREAGRRGAEVVAAGNPLAFALYESPEAFPDDFTRGIAAAEESGQLDRELAQWSRFYSDTAAEAMEQVSLWTPKLIYWATLLLVAALIIRSAMAYRDLILRLINLEG